MSPRTAPTTRQALEAGALAAVNGGYFNLSDGESASYVVVNGAMVADPTKNKALTGNPKLQPFLKNIFDRSELRVMQDSRGQMHYGVAAHGTALPQDLKLVDALQGGPSLLPELTAEQEAFVRHEPSGETTDSIGVMRTAARTAVGLTDKGQVLVISVAGKKQSEFSAGVDLATLAKLLKNLGATEAINFDGGTSTTMILKTGPAQTKKASADGGFKMLVGRTPETLVKSTLCIVESKK
ncbi:MAG: phosphodiester glycosidase family protein [Cyanobacteria bacterium SZAS LIN-2]|nr:phosphodiester glycosidase family protein [Cyanobacteria bacterium SZAS LIN-2]